MGETWIKVLLFLAGLVLFVIGYHLVMKKILGIKGKVSWEFVNETHKKIDWSIRAVTIVFLIVGYVMEWIWILQWGWVLFLLFFVTEVLRAVMQYKNAEDPKLIQLTISHVILIVIVYIVILNIVDTDFLGMI